jgi:hypothetical protein
MKRTKISVLQQGAPIVCTDAAYVHRSGEGIVAMFVDLESKYCETTMHGSSENEPATVYIEASERSLYLDDTKDREEPTEISFDGYPGWVVFSATIARYTLAVCLIDHY